MKKCTNCGAINVPEDQFCRDCGTQLFAQDNVEVKTPPSEMIDKKSTNPDELEGLEKGEIDLIAKKEVFCPHCSIRLEIQLAHEYQCSNCNHFFKHDEIFSYKCIKCSTVHTLTLDSKIQISCSICKQKYRLNKTGLYLASSPDEQSPTKIPAKFSFGILLILGIITLILSLVSYSGFSASFNNQIPSGMFNNIVIFIVLSLILWIIIVGLVFFMDLDQNLIVTEGISILVIDMLLTIFTAYIHSNPLEFSGSLPFALILMYGAWIALRLLIIFCASSDSTAEWYFWLCVCDSCTDCSGCNCENCSCDC